MSSRRKRHDSDSNSSSSSSSSSSSDEDDRRNIAKRRRNTYQSYSHPVQEPGIEQRLESLIIRVGEKSSSSLESNLEGLSGVLEADLSKYKARIMKIIISCVVNYPEKICIYATLVGLLNAKTYTFGREFLEVAVKQLKESMRVNYFDDARYLLRFISDLINCHVVSADSIMAIYSSFVETTTETNIPQVRSDWYVYCVLSALPWCGAALVDRMGKKLAHLLYNIQQYIQRRQKVHVPALKVWQLDEPHPQEEYLDCLWAQISKLDADSWVEKSIYRPYLAFQSILGEALEHHAIIISPAPHADDTAAAAGACYPLPRVVFRLFDYTDVPQEGPILPGSHSIERWLIEEDLHRIITKNYFERRETATLLLAYSPKNIVPLNYMIVEVILAQMFELPLPHTLELFYGALLLELCRNKPNSVPQVLAQSVGMLYERLDHMNLTCIDRFASWFAYHLSNFQFKWSWEDWEDALLQGEDMPKPMFIKGVLDKCMRLSYHQKMVDVTPESFKPLIPSKPAPYYKYQQEASVELPGTMSAHQLVASIKGKATPEEVLMLLKDMPNPLMENEVDEPQYNPLQVDVFVSTILYLGSKSFSHSIAALAKYYPVFKAFAPTEEAQMCVVKTMYEVWHNHHQMMIVLIDKMLKTQIISCAAVANWVFSNEMSDNFLKAYVWEIMHSTIIKMNKHVQKLRNELNDGRTKLRNSQAPAGQITYDDVPSEEMVERMEEKLEQAQSEQKKLFLIIFQRFIILLTDHLAQCEASATDFNTVWYKWCVGRLQQVFLLHHEQVYKYISTLESLLFTSDTDVHILELFQQFCALRS